MKTAEEILKVHLLNAGCLDEDDLNERFEDGEFEPELQAMSDFAAQSVREYKEKLKSEILARFKEHMAITPVKDLTDLIESTH